MKAYCINCKYHITENGRAECIGDHAFTNEDMHYCCHPKYLISPITENGRAECIGDHAFTNEDMHYCCHPKYLISPITGKQEASKVFCFIVNGHGQCKLFKSKGEKK